MPVSYDVNALLVVCFVHRLLLLGRLEDWTAGLVRSFAWIVVYVHKLRNTVFPIPHPTPLARSVIPISYLYAMIKFSGLTLSPCCFDDLSFFPLPSPHGLLVVVFIPSLLYIRHGRYVVCPLLYPIQSVSAPGG